MPAERRRAGIAYAFGAAALFGVSTPFAKLLLGDVPPVLLASLLYGGSAAGLTIWHVLRPARAAGPLVTRDCWPWLAGAIACGGVVAPALLMLGLSRTPAASAALLLNLEAVFTTLIAWFGFGEHYDWRIAAGMVLIVAGSVWLSWSGSGIDLPFGSLLIVLACAGWALDNNLTQRVAYADPVRLARLKGFVAAVSNLSLALMLGQRTPPALPAAAALVVGFGGYGLSLVLFVLALRYLGTARTGAYFSTAPFLGALAAFVLIDEPVSRAVVGAGVLMAVGVYLHVTEHHSHQHQHEPLAHSHSHRHDDHHRHPHAPGIDPAEPHTHWHEHEPTTHAHPHYPDIHHRHGHGTERERPNEE
jgi:drug/metabolite transporter (DMT)-like permease